MREIQRVKNPQVGVYYDENNMPYLTFKAEYHYDDGLVYAVNIPKIDLSKMKVNLEQKYDPPYYNYPPLLRSIISELTFDIVPNQNCNYYTLKDITPVKEMTIEEIEKQLGHKVKIKKEL